MKKKNLREEIEEIITLYGTDCYSGYKVAAGWRKKARSALLQLFQDWALECSETKRRKTEIKYPSMASRGWWIRGYTHAKQEIRENIKASLRQ